MKEGVQADGSYISKITPSDVGRARWSKEIDPADISRAAFRKAAIGLGIANDADEATRIVDNMNVDGLKTHTNKGTRFVDKSDVGFAAWMKQHLDGQGRWPVQTKADGIESLRESARQLKIGNPDVVIANSHQTAQQADAGAVLAGALALPKVAQQLPKAVVLAGEAAPPLLIATAGVAGTAALINQHVGVVKSNWEDAQKAKLMPLPMTMDDAEPMPLPIPDGQAKERPFAEPAAKPKITDLPNAPTDVVPVPTAKPKAKVEDLPQPYTPDVPKAMPPTPKSEPPINPKDILPPIIGATTAAAGKAAADAVNKTNQSTASEETRAKFKEMFGEARYNKEAREIEIVKSYRPELANIPTEDLVAVKGYTSDDYYEINEVLRNGDDKELKKLEAYIQCANSGTQSNAIVQRHCLPRDRLIFITA